MAVIPFRFDRIRPRFNERNESSIALLIQSRTEFARAREAEVGTRELERVPTSIFRFRKMILSTISDVGLVNVQREREREGKGTKSPGETCATWPHNACE